MSLPKLKRWQRFLRDNIVPTSLAVLAWLEKVLQFENVLAIVCLSYCLGNLIVVDWARV